MAKGKFVLRKPVATEFQSDLAIMPTLFFTCRFCKKNDLNELFILEIC